MDTVQKREVARREKILAFWKAHGAQATKDAFDVCERTLFRWQKNIHPTCRAHLGGYAKRVIDPDICREIIRLRTLHPRLGKEKVAPLLATFCRASNLPVVSESTVGRIMGELQGKGLLPSGAKLRMDGRSGNLLEKHPTPRRRKLRRNGYVPERPGDLLQVDGVLTFVDGKRRYTFTAVCLVSRWAFSKTYTTASSRNGADFLRCLLAVAPFSVTHIQTDNGSEFMKEFGEAVETLLITHFFNWVKQPKYQGWVERFNRTIQEEFLDWHHECLGGSPDEFNLHLTNWLIFYNTKRVHRSLGSSGQRLTPLQYLELTAD